jgi:hypothetical protein
MKKLAIATGFALLVAAAAASAQMSDLSSQGGTAAMTGTGSQPETTVVGKIKEFDLANRTLLLEDGTQLTLPESFEYTSFPAVGQEVEVTFDAQDPQKVIRSIDVNSGGNSGSSQ